MNSIDPRLKDVLDEQGHRVHVSVPDLADRAIARDRRNRRREVALMAAGAALALAIAVPVAVDLVGSNRATQIPAGPTHPVGTPPSDGRSPAPSPSVKPSATAIPTIQATDAGDAVRIQLATGTPTATTGLGYVTDNVYIEGSTRITLPQELHDPQWVARLGDGIVAVPTRGGDYMVVDAKGHLGRSIPTLSGAVVGDDRSHLVALDRGEDLVYYDSTGAAVARLAAARCECSTEQSHGSWEPVGIVGPLVYANRGHDKGHVVWNTATNEVVRAQGNIDLLNEEKLLALVTVPGEIAGDGDLICRELVDLGTGVTRWRLCGPIHFTGFSPDGAYLIGTGLIDGINPEATTGKFEALVVLRTDDADVVLQGGGDGTDPQSVGVVTARMDRDRSLTVETASSRGRALQRCELDGVCAVVTEPKPPIETGGDPAAPYLLSAN